MKDGQWSEGHQYERASVLKDADMENVERGYDGVAVSVSASQAGGGL